MDASPRPRPRRPRRGLVTPGPRDGRRGRARTPAGRAARFALRLAARLLIWGPVVVLLWPNRPYQVDLAAQFGPQTCIGIAAIAALLAMLRQWPPAIEAVAGLLIAGGTTLIMHRRWAAPGAIDEPFRRVRIVMFNAFGQASHRDQSFDAWLKTQNAGLVCLIDPPWAFARSHDWIEERYPHRIEPERGLWWSIVLYSAHPFTPERLAEPSDDLVHSFATHRSVRVDFGEGFEAIFTAVHPPSPRRPEDWARALTVVQRDGRLIGTWREEHDTPIIVAGDFNSTPTGRAHQTFGRLSGLRTDSAIFGRGTWPSDMSPLLSLPIDRVWVSPGMAIERVHESPRFNSDHRAVVVDVLLPRTGQPREPAEAGSGAGSPPPEEPES